jgi:ankyrin repeat protein
VFACCQGGRNALHVACLQGSLEAVSILLGAGANIEARNMSITTCVQRTAWTPLHHACERGCVAVVTVLLEAGADVRARDKVRLL